MNAPADTTESTPSPARALWLIGIGLGSALLLMWVAGRVKPVVIYPVMVGGVLGVWSRIAGSFCQMPRLGGWMLLPTTCAMAVTLGGLMLSAQRQADVKPAHPLAEQLLRQFEQQTQLESTAPSTASSFWKSLHARYRDSNAVRTATWIAAELGLAAAMCVLVQRSWSTNRP